MTWVRRHFFAVWCATMLVAVIVLAVLVGLMIRGSVNGGEERACERLNVVRASQNRTNRDAYASDSIELHLVEASILRQTASVRRTPAQQRATEQFLGEKLIQGQGMEPHFVGVGPPSGLRGVVEDLDWIALTDCHAAVHQSNYRPPSPRTFSERPNPPLSVYEP